MILPWKRKRRAVEVLLDRLEEVVVKLERLAGDKGESDDRV